MHIPVYRDVTIISNTNIEFPISPLLHSTSGRCGSFIVHTFTHVHTLTHTYTHAHTHTYTHTHTRTHTHTHTHAHTHSIAGVVVVEVVVVIPQVTGANGSGTAAEEDTLINTHQNNSLLAKTHVQYMCGSPRQYMCGSPDVAFFRVYMYWIKAQRH